MEQLALDLPKFMDASGREKAQTLLRIIGVGEQLAALEKKEKEQWSERQAIGRIADQKEKYAKEQAYYPDVPEQPVSASELIRQQQEILLQNGENQRKREQRHKLEQEYQALTEQIQELLNRQARVEGDLKIARECAEGLEDRPTAKLEENIAEIEEINRKVRANLDKERAEDDAQEYRRQYQALTSSLEETAKAKRALLENAELPLPDLAIEGGELVYKGQHWDNMSGSDRLRVATAIVRKLNPECGFVLLDKLEQMDRDTLEEFGLWLEEEGLQAIATRVSTGEECSIIIEDGYAAGQGHPPVTADAKGWKAGVF